MNKEKRMSLKQAMNAFYSDKNNLGKSFMATYPPKDYVYFIKPGLGFFVRKKRGFE